MHHMHSHVATAPTTTPTQGRLIRWAKSYDVMVHIATLGRSAQVRKRLANVTQVRVGDAMLDVGCGTGDLALQLAQRVGARGSVTGIDPSPEMIARAQQKAQRRQIAVDFRQEPAEALSFPDNTFDGVVSSLVFHHLPDELKHQAVQNIARVLKPGGRLTIIDFMNTAGQMGGHGGVAAGAPTFMYLLQQMGFVDATSGSVKFRALHMPPIGFVAARLPNA